MRLRMMLLSICCFALISTQVFAQSSESNTEQSFVTYPEKTLSRVKHFTPDAVARGQRLAQIIDIEQKRWGGPSIYGGVVCESTLNSTASNGRYRGPIQADGIFESYLWPGTPRKVQYVSTKKRKLPIIRHTHVGGLEWQKEVIGQRVQAIKTIYRGMLPRFPSAYHAWAAIRVGQRAAANKGPTTWWECTVAGSHYW